MPMLQQQSQAHSNKEITRHEIKPYQLLLHLSLKYYSWPLSVSFSNLCIHKQKWGTAFRHLLGHVFLLPMPIYTSQYVTINHICWVNQKFMPKNTVKPVLPPSPSLSHTHKHSKTIYVHSMNPWPLIGHNPGLLLAFILDIIPWEDIFSKWGLPIVPNVKGVEQRMKSQPTLWVWSFCFTHTCIIGVLFLGSKGH